jgi:hypothetical protein
VSIVVTPSPWAFSGSLSAVTGRQPCATAGTGEGSTDPATVSRNDGTEQAEEEVCMCCPRAVFQLFCSSNTGAATVERKADGGVVCCRRDV